MKTETKRGHKVLKIIGIILLIIFAVALIFFIKGKIHERRPWYYDNYFDDFKTDAVLEKKYSVRGSFETDCTEFKSDNSKIDTIRVFYPAELADSNQTYPMIVSVNASGTRARNYMAVLDRIASWGFIVVGNDDPQSGTGETASETLEFILNIGADSDLYGKIDKNNIGIMGYSQGGAGALCAVTNFDNGKLYKTIFTGSAAYPFLAHNMGWDYDVSKVTIPYFMTSGTGKTDDADVLYPFTMNSFRVKEDHRGKGYGSMLMNTALSDLKSKNFSFATIGVGTDEEKNQKMYEHMGFNRKIKDCFFDPCSRDKDMKPVTDEGFILLSKKL